MGRRTAAAVAAVAAGPNPAHAVQKNPNKKPLKKVKKRGEDASWSGGEDEGPEAPEKRRLQPKHTV